MIGRYWSVIATAPFECPSCTCPDTCDYRGTFTQYKCITGCGELSQRRYHVPQSWLTAIDPAATTITVVLWEEIGGTPADVRLVRVH
jgi:hypothetical protein